jgi:oxygen-independent coproporphyrinogen-3 oxidase
LPGRQSVHGLYLHIPFCFHKCHYCDFYSIVEPKGKPDRQEQFTDALIDEIRYQAQRYDLQPNTLFVGGGTPTLLRPDLWVRLLKAMRQAGVLDRVTEFTVEANPETVSPELMDVLAGSGEGGVNRVSLGAQSFNLDQLKTLERWHDPDTVPKAVAMVRAAGITNFNLDLIFAIPGQTIQSLDQDLDAALAMQPTHLSCYSLIFEPNTPLTQKMKMGRISQVGEDIEKEMYDHVMRRLDAEGFEHYEVSNWAKRSTSEDHTRPSPQRCQHNMTYWTNQDWLGLGPFAASHINGARWKNEPHLGRYLTNSPTPPTIDHEELSPRPCIGEQIMLGLRLREGLTLDWINQHIPIDDARNATIDEMIQINMLERTDTHLRLTRQGLFLADSVIAKLL